MNDESERSKQIVKIDKVHKEDEHNTTIQPKKKPINMMLSSTDSADAEKVQKAPLKKIMDTDSNSSRSNNDEYTASATLKK